MGNGHIDTSHQLGGISLLVAALTWALMSVLIKRVPSSYSPILVTTYSTFVAIVALTPFVKPSTIFTSQLLDPKILGGLLYLGIVSTACAFLLWNRGLQLLNASSGGLFFFFQPLVGTLLGWILLGEQIGGTFWIGSFLILSGVLLVIKEKEKEVNS
ncbi:Membrane protein [Bacillus subtilis subsp. subtilis]|nr:Membrane protein [Bacillus subtilis subsp. subtilis]